MSHDICLLGNDLQADASRKTLTVAATDTRSSIAVGAQLGVYHGDELALQGITNITAAKQAWRCPVLEHPPTTYCVVPGWTGRPQ